MYYITPSLVLAVDSRACGCLYLLYSAQVDFGLAIFEETKIRCSSWMGIRCAGDETNDTQFEFLIP